MSSSNTASKTPPKLKEQTPSKPAAPAAGASTAGSLAGDDPAKALEKLDIKTKAVYDFLLGYRMRDEF